MSKVPNFSFKSGKLVLRNQPDSPSALEFPNQRHHKNARSVLNRTWWRAGLLAFESILTTYFSKPSKVADRRLLTRDEKSKIKEKGLDYYADEAADKANLRWGQESEDRLPNKNLAAKIEWPPE